MEPAEVFWINDMETFEVIGDPIRMEIVELLDRPRSVKELAEAMQVPRTRLYHHIGLLVDAGIIRIVESRAVGALTERIYQVSARSYQPSAEFLSSADPKRQAQVMLDALFGATRADFVRAVEDGIISLEHREDEEESTEISRRTLRLTDEQLTRLIKEVGQIYQRFGELRSEEAHPVAVLSVVYRSARGRS